MDFLADVVAGLDRHQHELQILSRIEHAPEIAVLLGELLDIVHKATHVDLLSGLPVGYDDGIGSVPQRSRTTLPL
ncbi:MAG: hypothetical protein M5U32_21870 [Myxococcota bacterium]|nr:hypothetical protein [Myxococcota bacterium]